MTMRYKVPVTLCRTSSFYVDWLASFERFRNVYLLSDVSSMSILDASLLTTIMTTPSSVHAFCSSDFILHDNKTFNLFRLDRISLYEHVWNGSADTFT